MINPLYLPELREMLATNQRDELAEFCSALNAGRTADFMEGLTDAEVWRVLSHAPADRRAEIFTYFEPGRQLAMLAAEAPGDAAKLIEQLAEDDRVDLIEELPVENADAILDNLPIGDRRNIQRLRAYRDGTAGALMTTEVAKLTQRLTVRQTLDELAATATQLETIYYLYVVDDNNTLRGIVSTRQLGLVPSQPIANA